MMDKIANAKRVYFFGFRYDPENLKILGIKRNLSNKQEIHGTALGFTAKEISDIKKTLVSGFKWTDRLANIVNMDCLRFLTDNF